MEVTEDASVDDIAPVCNVLKGILAGQLGRFYKKLILDATEPWCVFSGAEYCEFFINIGVPETGTTLSAAYAEETLDGT